jgi:NAD(P)-dependent dehydrogenase (short-subunit alcohol dehydrogenase family)
MNYSSMTRLDDRVAIVTGGAGGIGFETATAFKACGARVVLVDINQTKGEEAAAREVGKTHGTMSRQGRGFLAFGPSILARRRAIHLIRR